MLNNLQIKITTETALRLEVLDYFEKKPNEIALFGSCRYMVYK
jgi:hypothetical protein